MSRPESQLEILQKLHSVEREIAKLRKQTFYWNRVKDTCFLQGYTDGYFSLILNLAAPWKVDDVSPIHASRGQGRACIQFTARISSSNAKDMSDRVEAEKKNMLVRVIDIVKRPDNFVVPSLVWLDIAHDTFKERYASGIYINPMKGTLDILPSLPNWEFGFIGDFVGEKSTDCAVPREVQSASHIVQGIPSNQGQIIQRFSGIGDFVYQRLSALSVVLDCGSASIFERNNGSCKVRDMYFGPFNLKASVLVGCAHKRECTVTPLG